MSHRHLPTQRWHECQRARLGAIADEWLATGVEPASFGVLSTSEQAAIAMAVGDERRMRSSVTTFLLFSPYLQQFFLERIGLKELIGQRVGIEGDGHS
jgi:hypothetical protein